jgi:hypothetical protein
MKKQCIYTSILIFLFITFSFGRTFTVEGGGPTPEAAQANAEKKALGKAISLYLPYSTQQANAAKLKECFYSRYLDFIAADRATSEDRTLGVVVQRRSVDVSTGKVRDVLAERGLIDARARKPVIALDVQVEKGDTGQCAVATASFSQALLAEGYRVAALNKTPANDGDTAAAESAFAAGADLLVRANLKLGEAKIENIYGESLPYVPIELHGRALQAGSGELVAARTRSVYRGSLSAISATEFGLRTGGAELCSLLVADLDGYWRGDGFNHRALRIEFLECAVDSIVSLQERLASIKSIRAARMVQADIRGVLFEADCAGNIHDAAASLTRDGMFSVGSMSANMLSLAPAHANSIHPSKVAGKPGMTAIFSVDTLFPSRAGAYEHDSIAHLAFVGGTAGSMVRIETSLPDFMALPATHEIALPSQGRSIVNIPLALDASKLLACRDAGTFYARCLFDMGEEGKRAVTAPVRVQGRNDYDWEIPDAIGGFITNEDPALLEIVAMVQHAIDNDCIDYNVRGAAGIFGYLRHEKITYVRDPFPTGGKAFDRVQYPRETLIRRAGDCDDLAVLYGALCMAMDVPAALIVYAEHVLVMINTGVPCRNKFAVSADTSLTVDYQGTVWLPIETTALKDGFVNAWSIAAADYRSAIADQRDVSIISLSQATRRYRPVSPPGPLPKYAGSGYEKSVMSELRDFQANDRSTIERQIDGLGKHSLGDAVALNRIALLEAYRGRYAKAADLMGQAYARTRSPKAGNNYACALALAGKTNESQRLFDSLCKAELHGPVMVNRALSLLPLTADPSMQAAFNVLLNAALKAFSSPDSVLDLLCIAKGPSLKAADASQGKSVATVNRQRLRELVLKRIAEQRKTLATPSASWPATVTLAAGVRGADPKDLEKLVTLFFWYETL